MLKRTTKFRSTHFINEIKKNIKKKIKTNQPITLVNQKENANLFHAI